jgi:subtilisin family serine protease
MGEEFNVRYSTEDVLSHYHLTYELEDLRGSSTAFPLVALVPEGEEQRYAAAFRERDVARAAVPNFLVSPVGARRANLSEINLNFLLRTATFLGWGGSDLRYGSDTKIAIIDTGVDPYWLVHAESLHQDQYATDEPSAIDRPYDLDGHGSVVARVINTMVPSATLYSIKMFSGSSGNVGGLINALILAQLKFRPDIYNLSLAVTCDVDVCGSCGNPLGSQSSVNRTQLKEFFAYFDDLCRAANDDQPLLVAAAGNYSKTVRGKLPRMPATFSNLLAVGSYDMNTRDLAPYSDYAEIPEDRFLLAPGGLEDENNALAFRMGYGKLHGDSVYGTSFAAAFVTGISALYLHDADLGANPAGGGRSKRQRLMTLLEETADRSFPSFSRNRHGLGLVRYDSASVS